MRPTRDSREPGRVVTGVLVLAVVGWLLAAGCSSKPPAGWQAYEPGKRPKVASAPLSGAAEADERRPDAPAASSPVPASATREEGAKQAASGQETKSKGPISAPSSPTPLPASRARGEDTGARRGSPNPAALGAGLTTPPNSTMRGSALGAGLTTPPNSTMRGSQDSDSAGRGSPNPAESPPDPAESLRPAALPTVSLGEKEPGRDLFGPLRRAGVLPSAEKKWSQFAEALAHLKTLEGAHFDAESGRLFLVGEHTDAHGPFHLEDLMVALWAQFHERLDPGMTIDPVKENKTGPEMDVKFSGGAENTHLGWVMFECDRMMKCLSLGEDNVTRKPVTVSLKGFHTHPMLTLALTKESTGATWARFWIVSALEKTDEKDSRGKPVLEISEDKRTVWFKQWRMYVQTEQMFDAGEGRDLVSSGGKQEPASKYFADFFTAHYDEIAQQHPVFGELKESAKLVALAEWIWKFQVPIDHETLYLHVARKHPTPLKTPTLSASASDQQEGMIRTVTVFGGVNLKPRTFYAQDTEGDAKQLAAGIQPQMPEARRLGWAQIPGRDGKPRRAAGIPNRARAPPEPPEEPRAALKLVESRGEPDPTGTGQHAVRVAVDTRLVDQALGGQAVPVFRDPASGADQLNWPVLRVGYHARRIRTIEITLGAQKYTVKMPEYCYLTSPLRDVDVQFTLKPEIDRARNEPFFPSTTEGVKGYYPNRSAVVLQDGTTYRFQADSGLIESVEGAGKAALSFVHRVYEDGALVRPSPEDPNLAARPPPQRAKLALRLARGELAPTGAVSRQVRLDPAQLGPVRAEIRNQQAGAAVQVRRLGENLVLSVK